MQRNHTPIGLDSSAGLPLLGTAFPWFDRESYPHVLEKARREGKKLIRRKS